MDQSSVSVAPVLTRNGGGVGGPASRVEGVPVGVPALASAATLGLGRIWCGGGSEWSGEGGERDEASGWRSDEIGTGRGMGNYYGIKSRILLADPWISEGISGDRPESRTALDSGMSVVGRLSPRLTGGVVALIQFLRWLA
jgi:hypothetical protein